MIKALLFAMLVTVSLPDGKPLSCPIGGEPASEKVSTVDYKGVRYSFCCDGCVGKFAKDPTAGIKAGSKSAGPIGTFMFDPVSRIAILPANAKATTDFDHVRYYFSSKENLDAFKKSPAKFAAAPAKEVLRCPVADEKLDGYAGAYAYGDYQGVRYYICCAGCAPKFAKTPEKFAPAMAKYVAAPAGLTRTPGQAVKSECKD